MQHEPEKEKEHIKGRFDIALGKIAEALMMECPDPDEWVHSECGTRIIDIKIPRNAYTCLMEMYRSMNAQELDGTPLTISEFETMVISSFMATGMLLQHTLSHIRNMAGEDGVLEFFTTIQKEVIKYGTKGFVDR